MMGGLFVGMASRKQRVGLCWWFCVSRSACLVILGGDVNETGPPSSSNSSTKRWAQKTEEEGEGVAAHAQGQAGKRCNHIGLFVGADIPR